MRLDIAYVAGNTRRIEIIGVGTDRERIESGHEFCIAVEKWAVGLQMDSAAIVQHFAVELHETSRSQAFAHLLHLRIGESYPYLGDLAGREK